ncbi:transient receptor potential cation channel subfamily A member 1-like isoform X2 [Corticium candelabrum]|uniref:transient receptor potential cation channel subfamily A member 1-like isoform X2 n=1 Tax=Corticium candelabrum TaxID=121492 RepID=UPI002E25822B|nr:transient receptor potential cation channel subfamily A member 1-like isoform X2 [Corticium candelabrum]
MAEKGFLLAQRERSVSTVVRLIKADSSSTSTKKNLHELAASGRIDEFARRLAKSSTADVNKRNDDEQTPLHCAVENKQDAIVELLCQASKSGKVTIDPHLKDNHKRTPLHWAVNTGKIELVKAVLSIPQDVNQRGPNNRTPLHMAARDNKPEIANLLLQHGADPLLRDNESKTALGLAVVTGSISIIDVFLSTRGVQLVNLLESISGEDRSNLLHLAADSGSPEMVVYLMHRNINKVATDFYGCTVIHRASRCGNPAVLRQCSNVDKQLFDSANSEGFTPLHEAARCDHVGAVNFLLEKGAMPDKCSASGLTPLLLAAAFGACKVVRILLSLQVDCLKTDQHGANVIHLAVGHTKTLKVLAEILKPKGIFEELLHGQDINGSTPLHYAAHHGGALDINFFIENEASAVAVNHNGSTPLHIAASRGHVQIAAKLYSYSLRSLHATDKNGQTPLHLACFFGHTNVVSNLLENGATVTQDHNGRTQLHFAAWNGSVDCMKKLVSVYPKELITTDIEKATPLHLAVVQNHADMTAYLLDQDDLSDENVSLCRFDNKFGQNSLDVALALGNEDCTAVIVKHKGWRKSMKPLGSNKKTQLELMVEKMPDQALALMDNCISFESQPKNRRIFDFRHMQGVTNMKSPVPAMCSLHLLESMVKFRRTACMAHSLCVEFLNSKWRKFGAAVAFTNVAMYSLFLLALTVLVIQFPAYTDDPLNDGGQLQHLLEVLDNRKSENEKHLTLSFKRKFCYGSLGPFVVTIVFTIFGLLKETLPMFFEKSNYLKLSNVSELLVYILTLVFLDPFGLILNSYNVPEEACPKVVWQLGAITVFLAWLVLLLYLRRLPALGIYLVMIVSMLKTLLQVAVVVSLFVLGFALSFYMLINKTLFESGELSLVRVIVMLHGDMQYDNILPPSRKTMYNLTCLQRQLTIYHKGFDFINVFNLSVNVDDTLESNSTCALVDDHPSPIDFPELSYALFLIFVLLMPVVVFNVLIGLAVGDIAAVRAGAALTQIRMQMKLLIQLERVLPSCIRSRFQVLKSVQVEDDRTLRGWFRHIINAAGESNMSEVSKTAEQLTEIKSKHRQLDGWLSSIQKNLDQQKVVIKLIAFCLKKTEGRQPDEMLSQPTSGPQDSSTSSTDPGNEEEQQQTQSMTTSTELDALTAAIEEEPGDEDIEV